MLPTHPKSLSYERTEIKQGNENISKQGLDQQNDSYQNFDSIVNALVLIGS